MFTYTTGQQIKSQSHKKSGDAMKVVSPAIKIWRQSQMKTAKKIEILIIAILVVIIFHDTIVEIIVSLLG